MTALQALWINPQQANDSLRHSVIPFAKPLLLAGHRLVLSLRLAEDQKTDRQRSFLHRIVLMDIARQAKPEGKKYPMLVWKEHFRKTMLGFKTVTHVDPLTGKKHRRRQRISTEDLGVRAYSEYIDRVIAYAATEQGVEFTQRRWQDYVDPDTGEILS